MTPRVQKFWMESVIPDEFQPEYVGECNVLTMARTAEKRRTTSKSTVMTATTKQTAMTGQQ